MASIVGDCCLNERRVDRLVAGAKHQRDDFPINELFPGITLKAAATSASPSTDTAAKSADEDEKPAATAPVPIVHVNGTKYLIDSTTHCSCKIGNTVEDDTLHAFGTNPHDHREVLTFFYADGDGGTTYVTAEDDLFKVVKAIQAKKDRAIEAIEPVSGKKRKHERQAVLLKKLPSTMKLRLEGREKGRMVGASKTSMTTVNAMALKVIGTITEHTTFHSILSTHEMNDFIKHSRYSGKDFSLIMHEVCYIWMLHRDVMFPKEYKDYIKRLFAPGRANGAITCKDHLFTEEGEWMGN